ncbi:glycolate oxidase subunit GlcF [Thiobacter aerophilum]|uniref:Glycolate oxidase iron-sulfur subunit n=1 Tax=Thiobacter aerophilum TaxID=3121275 RepID=A0ABV0EE61_9BURK
MQTQLADFIRDTPQGREADRILRTCVHCGFCLATCPTYQVLGDELDSPRGRIYLIKRMLEGEPASQKTLAHLDRCLTCRACETTCPSGVEYARLLDIGRHLAEERVGRSLANRMARRMLRYVLAETRRFAPVLALARRLRPLLPKVWQRQIPSLRPAAAWPAVRHPRRMLVLAGCVQPALAPNINAAAARLLDRLGISLVVAPEAGCCGALSFHLNAQEEARDYMRRNIDAWWPHVEAGVEAIVMTASGCGVMVRDYGHYLREDARYAEKARRISALTRDVAEVVLAQEERLASLVQASVRERVGAVAVHTPCTLQHGQKLKGLLERILARAGVNIAPAPEGHLCCGSAGTYSILQKSLSQQLLARKVAALEGARPARIVTANIGCLTHLQSGTRLPVSHWVELLDELTA